ncbi:phage tail tape measure protein [Brochothrix thermosphacta]|uniref:phage tail tape measure protein n=2 Tax=Bacteria TaxID=2 RepID=UPI00083F8C25|nr:phage tail tape measure protein [Brochothrix thermosphacta]ODJ64892.1 hypothetical protein BFR36_09705 [Brochothrix thermosphacta]SOC32667.1 protein of unknown function [Brochothrix thermosphacta]
MFKTKEKKTTVTIPMRYKFQFIDVPKKINRSMKKFNIKTLFSITETQEWLEKMSDVTSESFLITIACKDEEEGVEYELDGIKIYSNSKPNLLEIIEQQFLEAAEIQNSSHIVTTINRQYQDEVANGGYEYIEEIQNEIIQSTEISSPVPEVSENEDVYEEKEEAMEIPFLSNENEEEAMEIVSDTPIEEDENEEHIESYLSETTQEIVKHSDVTEDNYNAVVQPLEQKNTVVFPEYENYHSLNDVTSISETITRFQERLQPDNLVKMLGLTTLADKTDNQLKDITYNYAMNSLNEQEFVLLNDHFIKETERVLKINNGHLAQAYEQAMLMNYEQKVLESKAEEIEAINQAAINETYDFEVEQMALFNSKREKMQVEHEAQIKALESKLRNEMSLFEATETERLNNLKAQVKQNAEKTASEEISKLKDVETYNLKSQSVRYLVDGKREMINSTITELDEAINNIWDNTLAELQKLKEKLEDKTPEWRAGIKEQQEMRLKEQAEEREQQKIDLERMKIESENSNVDQLKRENEDLMYKLRESNLDQKGLQNENSLLREKNERVGVFSKLFK